MFSNLRRYYLIYLFLIIVTAAVYMQAIGFEFSSLDDHEYITENPHVLGGLSMRSVHWAFTTGYGANWHPLTWMSLMLDHNIGARILNSGIAPGRENPRVYHLTNIILHIINALLLFAMLNAFVGNKWRSAFVAALFALHPLHVESVVWATERKDVLSTLFWMLTMLAYLRYARRPTGVRYAAVAGSLALGLMAKSMLVSLPLVLLLLDFWPLRRLGTGKSRSIYRVLLEKAPLFALSIAASVLTLLVQEKGGAVSDLGRLTLGVRLANAAYSSIKYIAMMLWPTRLACYYPHPQNTLPSWQIMGSVLVLICFMFFAIRSARSRPYLLTGWLWYVITLVPVIGIIQVGGQAMADRYTYVPLIGLFIATTWAVPDLFPKKWVGALPVIAGVVICIITPLAYRQAGYWCDDLTLYSHAVEVTDRNTLAHSGIANILMQQGKVDEAAEHYEKVLAINNRNGDAHIDLANILDDKNRTEEAIHHYREGLRFRPERLDAMNNLAEILAETNDPRFRNPSEAIILAEYVCSRTKYKNPSLLDTLASAYFAAGRKDEAEAISRKAIALAKKMHQNDVAAQIERRMRAIDGR